jgi:hypothetical protein
MQFPPRALIASLAAVAIAGPASAGPARGPARGTSRHLDSVAVRVAFKVQRGEMEHFRSSDWGCDSLTSRLAPGMSVRGDFLSVSFTLGHIVPPDSAWLIYPQGRLGVDGR